MEKRGNNLKILVNSKIIAKRNLTQESEEDIPELKWKLQKNLDGYVIYRTVDDITEKFIIKNNKAWFETQLEQTKPKIMNSKQFRIVNEDNNEELLNKGKTVVTSYIIQSLQNGELTLWLYDNIPFYSKIIFTVVSDYKLEKYFDEGIETVNKWHVDITSKKLIATKENLQYTLNLENGEEALRKDDNTIYLRHYNVLNFNEINLDFNEENVILNLDNKSELVSVSTY